MCTHGDALGPHTVSCLLRRKAQCAPSPPARVQLEAHAQGGSADTPGRTEPPMATAPLTPAAVHPAPALQNDQQAAHINAAAAQGSAWPSPALAPHARAGGPAAAAAAAASPPAAAAQNADPAARQAAPAAGSGPVAPTNRQTAPPGMCQLCWAQPCDPARTQQRRSCVPCHRVARRVLDSCGSVLHSEDLSR